MDTEGQKTYFKYSQRMAMGLCALRTPRCAIAGGMRTVAPALSRARWLWQTQPCLVLAHAYTTRLRSRIRHTLTNTASAHACSRNLQQKNSQQTDHTDVNSTAAQGGRTPVVDEHHCHNMLSLDAHV